MPQVDTILNILSWGSVMALLCGLVAAGRGRWRVALVVSRAVIVAGVILFLAGLGTSIILPLAVGNQIDPSMKATVLSKGISEIMNCGALALLVSFPAAFLWGFSKRRIAAASQRAG